MKPTMTLKWFSTEYTKTGSVTTSDDYNASKDLYTLKQLWKDDKGNKEWRAIEYY